MILVIIIIITIIIIFNIIIIIILKSWYRHNRFVPLSIFIPQIRRPEDSGSDDEVHGVLVKKILEMKKGIEEMEGLGADNAGTKSRGASGADNAAAKGVDDALRGEREKEKENIKKDVAKVRVAIQQLSR